MVVVGNPYFGPAVTPRCHWNHTQTNLVGVI